MSKNHIPRTPKEVCHCVLPIIATGLNYYNGWGETWCYRCNRHMKWGVGDFPLERKTEWGSSSALSASTSSSE